MRTLKRVLALALGCLLAGLLLVPPRVCLAQQARPDNEGFVAESRPADMNPKKESIPATPLVAAAYGFIWLAVMVYVGSVAVRARRLEADIAELQHKLDSRPSAPGA